MDDQSQTVTNGVTPSGVPVDDHHVEWRERLEEKDRLAAVPAVDLIAT